MGRSWGIFNRNIKSAMTDKQLKEEISKILDDCFRMHRSGRLIVKYPEAVQALEALIKKHEREVIERIKVHFETMVFEDTHSSYDSFKFRKKQSMYLEEMLAKLKEVEK